MQVEKKVNGDEIKLVISKTNYIYSNLIRAYANDKIKIKVLTFEKDDIVDIEKYGVKIIWESLIDRLEMVPINQDIPEDSTFTIKIDNRDNKKSVPIYLSDIKGPNDKYLFAKTIEIGHVREGCLLHIKNIKVKSGYGFESQKYTLGAFTWNPNEDGSTVTMTLEVNGDMMKPTKWYDLTLQAIVNDLKELKNIYTEKKIGTNVSIFMCPDYSPQIGKAISYSIYELYPDIENVSDQQTHQSVWDTNIRIKCDDPNKKFNEGIDHLIKIYEKLQK